MNQNKKAHSIEWTFCFGAASQICLHFCHLGAKIAVRLRPAVAGGAHRRRIWSFKSVYTNKNTEAKRLRYFYGAASQIWTGDLILTNGIIAVLSRDMQLWKVLNCNGFSAFPFCIVAKVWRPFYNLGRHLVVKIHRLNHTWFTSKISGYCRLFGVGFLLVFTLVFSNIGKYGKDIESQGVLAQWGTVFLP